MPRPLSNYLSGKFFINCNRVENGTENSYKTILIASRESSALHYLIFWLTGNIWIIFRCINTNTNIKCQIYQDTLLRIIKAQISKKSIRQISALKLDILVKKVCVSYLGSFSSRGGGAQAFKPWLHFIPEKFHSKPCLRPNCSN